MEASKFGQVTRTEAALRLFGVALLLGGGALALHSGWNLLNPGAKKAPQQTATAASAPRAASAPTPRDTLAALAASNRKLVVTGIWPRPDLQSQIGFSNGHMEIGAVGKEPVWSGSLQWLSSPDGTCLGAEYHAVLPTQDAVCIAVRDFQVGRSEHQIHKGDLYFVRETTSDGGVLSDSPKGHVHVNVFRVEIL